MIDDRDPLLTRLFAEQSQPAHESGFMAQLANLLERDRRRQRMYRIGTIIAGVIVAALLAPWIAQGAALAIGSVAAGITATRSHLTFPMAWLVLCSTVGSLLPVITSGLAVVGDIEDFVLQARAAAWRERRARSQARPCCDVAPALSVR